MTTRMVIEFDEAQAYRAVLSAIDAYKQRLRAGIARGRRQLTLFEERYGVSTEHFLTHMAAEDLSGGDMEYVEWAGEAKLLGNLETELAELEQARYELPGLS
ncbi:MAG: hypothetical protein IPH95_17380 [Candidatus Promineofilum sp.]|nr:hypothetical protein [Promineifilum sp.]